MKPIIGIQAQKMPEEKFFRLPYKYTEAIFAGGGIPIILPLLPHRDYLENVWPLLDGIVLSGCWSDLDPKLYGEEPHPKLGPLSEIRDRFDWLLLDRVFDERMPVMGICRGFQTLNVYRGGKLIQDLASEMPSGAGHEVDSPANHFAHGVRLAPRTILNPSDTELVRPVNSEHHQGVREIGKGFIPIAWSEDGVVEAVQAEDLSKHYVLGMQWHPERTTEVDEFSLQIFRQFIAAVAQTARLL